jgi:uncharacterized protein (TIGR02246 family)
MHNRIHAGRKQAPPPPAPDTHDADVKAIRDLETDWEQAFAAKDVDKLSAFYADDASCFFSDGSVITGFAAIKASLKPYLDDKNSSFSYSSNKVDVQKSGDLGYSQITYTMTMTDPKTKKVVSEKGIAITVYKKQSDGSWKIAMDIAQ